MKVLVALLCLTLCDPMNCSPSVSSVHSIFQARILEKVAVSFSLSIAVYLNLSTDYCWRRQWHPTLVLLPGKSHGWRSLVSCSPWGREESNTTERLHLHFSLSCIGEGNGNPLQCSCLENPRDGEPGGLPSMGSHRVRHDWSDLAAVAALTIVFSKAYWKSTYSQKLRKC